MSGLLRSPSRLSGKKRALGKKHLIAASQTTLPIRVEPVNANLVPFGQPLPVVNCRTVTAFDDEREIDDYFHDKFDEILSAFSTSDPLCAKRKRRGLSDNEYYLIKLKEKICDELPRSLYPDYAPHDYSIYDDNVQFIVNNSMKPQWMIPNNTTGVNKMKRMIKTATVYVNAELRDPQLDIISAKISKRKGEVTVKWRVSGTTRSNLILGRMNGELKVYTFISNLQVDRRQAGTEKSSEVRANEIGLTHRVVRHEITDIEIDQGKLVQHSRLGFPLVLGALGMGAAGVGGNEEFESVKVL